MNYSKFKLFGINEKINLLEHIVIPDICKNGLFKCKVIYDKIIKKVEFEPIS